jgi:hypothetical protein
MKWLGPAYGLSFLNIVLFLQEAAVPVVAQVPAMAASVVDLATIMDLTEMQL